MLVLRALVVWLGMMVLAILNGAFREGALVALMGPTARHVASTLLLCALIGGVAWIAVPWIHPISVTQAWTVGVVWLLLTLAFEFRVGHYVLGTPWEELLADYNVLRGRVWVLVLITVTLAPVVVTQLRTLS